MCVCVCVRVCVPGFSVESMLGSLSEVLGSGKQVQVPEYPQEQIPALDTIPLAEWCDSWTPSTLSAVTFKHFFVVVGFHGSSH